MNRLTSISRQANVLFYFSLAVAAAIAAAICGGIYLIFKAIF